MQTNASGQSDEIQFRVLAKGNGGQYYGKHLPSGSVKDKDRDQQQWLEAMKDADSDIFNDALDGGGIEPSLDESIRESIRCSFVSSDSEQSLPEDPSRDQFVMSRLNWITSLKLLFDQLEAFNSSKQRHVEVLNFLKALRKVKPLLPLLARNDYYRGSSDVAFSYREVELGVTQMPKYITFDSVYDLFLSHKPIPAPQRAHQQPVHDYSSQNLQTSMMLDDENDQSYISDVNKVVVEQQEQIEEPYHQYRTNHAQMKASKASILVSAAATNAYSSIQQERSTKSASQPQNEIFVLSFAEGVLQMANAQGSWVENTGQQKMLAALKAPLMLNTTDDDEACEIDSEGGGDAMDSSQGSGTHENRRRSNKNKLEESVRSSRTATFKSIRNASLHQQQINVTQSSIHNTSQPSFNQQNHFQQQSNVQTPQYQDSYYYSQPSPQVQQQQQYQGKQPLQYVQQLPYQHHGQQASIGSRKELNESQDSGNKHSRTSSQKYKESMVYESATNRQAEKTRISSQNSGQKTTGGPQSNHNNTLLSQSSQSSSSYRQSSAAGQANLQSKISVLTSGTNSLSGLNQSNFIDLDLSQKGLTTFEMDFRVAYGDKKVLRSINLAQNGLMKLPLNVEKSLQYLNMSYNKLKSLSGIEGCVNLKLLNVSGNYITSASNIIILQSMRELIFAHNLITTTKDIAQLKNLNLLDLSQNKLVELDKIIPLQNLKKLNILSLYGNQIQKQLPNYDSTLKKMMPWVQILDPDQIRDFTQFSLMENVCFTEPPLIQVEQQNSQHLLTQNPMILNREIFNTDEKQKERSKTPNKERTKSNQLGSFDNRLKSSAVSPHRRQTMDQPMFQPLTSARLANSKLPTAIIQSKPAYNEQQFKMQGKAQLPQQLQQKGNTTSRNNQQPQRSALTESRLDKSQNRDKSPQQPKNIIQQNKSQVRDRSTSNISKNNPITVKPQLSTVNSQLKGSAEKVMPKQQQPSQAIKKIAVNVNVANANNKVQLASNTSTSMSGKMTPKSGMNGNHTPRQEQVTHYYKKSFCHNEGAGEINMTLDTPPSENNTVKTQDSSGKKPTKLIIRNQDIGSITLSPGQKKEMYQAIGVQQINSRNQLGSGNRPATTLKQRANTSQTADYQVLNQTLMSLPQSTKNSVFSQSFAFDQQQPGSSNIITSGHAASNQSSRPSSQLQKFITASKTQSKTVIGNGVVQTPVISQPCQKLTNLPPRAYQSRIENPGDKKFKADMHSSSILSHNTQTNQSTVQHNQTVIKTSMILQSEDTMNDIDEDYSNNLQSRVSSGSLSPVGDESSNIKKLQVDLTQFMGSNKLQ